MKKHCLLCRVPDCQLELEQDIRACPLNKFLAVLGGKRGMIVLLLLETPKRFGELKKLLPDISEKMLISTLQSLEKAQYITKEKILGKQIQSTYTITQQGNKALRRAESMAEMGKML